MIEPIIGIAVFAVLFAAFGTLRSDACGTGGCGACQGGSCAYRERREERQ